MSAEIADSSVSIFFRRHQPAQTGVNASVCRVPRLAVENVVVPIDASSDHRRLSKRDTSRQPSKPFHPRCHSDPARVVAAAALLSRRSLQVSHKGGEAESDVFGLKTAARHCGPDLLGSQRWQEIEFEALLLSPSGGRVVAGYVLSLIHI